jgi:predicted PhzF superfamily epimerase YddE/YHI9
VPQLHVLRVFVNEESEWGNRLGVFLHGREVAEGDRQRVAADLGFSETVFVDHAETGELRIFTPEVEFPFAGHPLVGTAWLMAMEGVMPQLLRPPAGDVSVHAEGELTFIVGRGQWSPPFEEAELADPAEVEVLTEAPIDAGDVYAWAWIDEAEGTMRARCFAPAVGIAEDEATGSAALALCCRLDRPITVYQGNGSILVARPLQDGWGEVGGRCALDRVRDYAL